MLFNKVIGDLGQLKAVDLDVLREGKILSLLLISGRIS